jgi:transcriptional regulator with XRE-family HTH domain
MSRKQARQLQFSPERLTAFRSGVEITQEELARELQVGLRTVTRWEAGVGQPAANTLLLLADVLGIEPDDLYVEEAAA